MVNVIEARIVLIVELRNILVQKHGDGAMAEAEKHSAGAITRKHVAGEAAWRSVLNVMPALLAKEPDGEDRRNDYRAENALHVRHCHQ